MNIKNKIFSVKKLAILLMVLVFAVTLVACNTKTGTPYGSISDSVYLKVGDYEITEKELYEQFRLTASGQLINMIDKLAFEDVEMDVSDLNEFQVELFEKEINKSVFGSESIKPKQIADYPEHHIARQLLTFVDSFVIVNSDVNKAELINYLEDIVADVVARASAVGFDEEAPFVFGYLDKDSYPTYKTIIDSFVEQYKLPVLKKVYAKSILGDLVDGELTGELADEDSDVYIEESDIVSHYKANVAGKYDVKALIIEFTSVKEHEIARFKHAIKSNSRGVWFRIPNLSDQDVIDALKADDYDDNTPLGKAKKIITDDVKDGGLGKSLNNLEVIDYRSSEFETYYNKYSLNSDIDEELDDSMTQNEVLNVFLQIYDELNGTNFATNDLSELASGEDHRNDIEDYFTYKYSDNLFSKNTSLRSYVYGLDNEALYYETLDGPDEDGKTYARPYSRQVQTFNSRLYLVYLLDDNRTDDDNILDDSDEDNVVFEDNELAQAKRTEALEKLVENKLTSSYVSEKVKEKTEDNKVNIYDSIIRTFYENTKGEYNGSKGFLDNDTLASVNDHVITVDDFYKEVEEALGLSTAFDLLLVKKLYDVYGDEITSDDEKDFRKQFESQYVNPFLANQYAQAGFPATIGLDKFLLLAFGAKAKDGKSATKVALDRIYVESKLRELFEEDIETHYAGNTLDNNIYKKYTELANNIRENELSIQASHFLVYLDLDGDDSPDDPNKIDFSNLKDINNLEELEVIVGEFIEEITKRAKLKSTMKDGLQSVIASYEETTRYTLTVGELPANPTQEEVMDYLNQYNRDDVWVKFRRIGLKVKYEELGEITNQKNFPSEEGGYDVDFFEYSMALANYIQDELAFMRNEDEGGNKDASVNEILPLYAPELTSMNEDFDNDRAIYSVENTRSGFGWHLILVTGYNEPASAKVEARNDMERDEYTSDIDNPYNEDEKLVAYNDNDELTWEQILIYLEESKEETGVVTLTTKAQNAINKYFKPVYDRYNNSYSQLQLAFKFLFGDDISLENEVLNSRLNALLESNTNQLNGYAYFKGYDGTGNTLYDKATSKEYRDVYQSWDDILNNR